MDYNEIMNVNYFQITLNYLYHYSVYFYPYDELIH
jgi:hypothetical protein